jgi:hypothetical protein
MDFKKETRDHVPDQSTKLKKPGITGDGETITTKRKKNFSVKFSRSLAMEDLMLQQRKEKGSRMTTNGKDMSSIHLLFLIFVKTKKSLA